MCGPFEKKRKTIQWRNIIFPKKLHILTNSTTKCLLLLIQQLYSYLNEIDVFKI